MVGRAKRALYAGFTWTAYRRLGAAQATPSLMTANVRKYAPASLGARTVAVTSRVAPVATFPAPSGLRRPSHTTIVPKGSCQWYESATCPAAGAVPLTKGTQASSPVFVSVTFTATSVPAPIVAGGVVLYVAARGTPWSALATPAGQRRPSRTRTTEAGRIPVIRARTALRPERHRPRETRAEPAQAFRDQIDRHRGGTLGHRTERDLDRDRPAARDRRRERRAPPLPHQDVAGCVVPVGGETDGRGDRD